MDSKSICCFNGAFYTLGEIKFSTENRSFRYGDGVFETIRCFGNRPVLFDLHYNRMLRAVTVLEMNTLTLPSRDILLKKIEAIINRNKYFVSSRVRISIFRNDGGLYTPQTNDCSYFIEASPLSDSEFVLNEKGLIAGVYTEMKKAPGFISNFKTSSSLLFVMAGLYKKKMSLSEVFIMNTDGLVIEALASNLFWIKNNVLYTSSVSSGCVDGVMRRVVIDEANKIGIRVMEMPGIDYNELKKSDEIFTTNAIQGINWVVGIEDQRYFNFKTREIHQQIQKFYK